ncbi:uncharacterized protein LOC106868822 isoform X1 [Octopus bimaculoides]|uniref:Uncharacterized protein n=1 Tax=Octopus bimaculoides TaxID=37653 RepID=A0A0L8HSH0_OCTBM|nr:uncharacterized protein LOC106868822 isoform X1 [Octopus bimaculoides]XP_014769728.1 uncharacterized protein LOC106868822 isoform X1 [Octopus bimaculoides]|eukprot:XP_014769727.1 PREDICTED: uncharacterized protein LOC106868822 isoform X1 [Octopus bimaculoides]
MASSGIQEHNEARRKQMHMERIANLQKSIGENYRNTYETEVRFRNERKQDPTASKLIGPTDLTKQSSAKDSMPFSIPATQACGYRCIYEHEPNEEPNEKKTAYNQRFDQAQTTQQLLCNNCKGKLNYQKRGDRSYGMQFSPYKEIYSAKLPKRFTTTDYLMQW